jgi:hypothetical protein
MAMSATARLWFCLILAVGFLFRAIQTHLGLPYVYNFDDPQIAAHALTIMKTGDWNPHFFAYGSLMIYIDTIVDAANYLRLAGVQPGQPESLASYHHINNINSIAAPVDGQLDWYWTISHPSFYLWDRYVTATFGTATIAVTYALSRRVIPGLLSLLPALLLAIMPVHIVQSGLTTTDVPVALFVCAATLAALIFAETGRLTPFLTSLLFTGLAGATKYNSGVVLVVPLIALVIQFWDDRGSIRWWHWALLIAVPAATFLAAMPYALLDFKHFITDLADSVSSYHAPGPRQARPGIRHLRLILGQFAENFGMIGGLLSLIGIATLIVALRTRKSLAVLIAFPVLFILYMSTTTTDYHRNYMQVYPFLCLYAGYAMFMMSTLFAGFKAPTYIPAVICLLLASIAAVPLLYHSIANAAEVARARDTRTEAVLRAEALTDVGQFEVLDELHIHSFDLNRLSRPKTEVNEDRIMHDICAATSSDGRVFILPSALQNTDFLGGSPDRVESIQRLNALLAALRQMPNTVPIGISIPTPSWGPPVNPGVIIVRSQSGLCDSPQSRR